jgi:hypothetical protein
MSIATMVDTRLALQQANNGASASPDKPVGANPDNPVISSSRSNGAKAAAVSHS